MKYQNIIRVSYQKHNTRIEPKHYMTIIYNIQLLVKDLTKEGVLILISKTNLGKQLKNFMIQHLLLYLFQELF